MTRHGTRLGAVFAIAALWLSLVAVPASAGGFTTYWVDDDVVAGDGPDACDDPDYAVIQTAIDDADPGDQIFVCPGRYPEQLTLDKNVLVRAWPLFRAHIDVPGDLTSPDGTIAAVRLVADDAKFRGFRIHVDSGTNILVPQLLPLCTHVDVAILVLGQDNVVRNNKIDVDGDETLTGHCGYDYGIVVGQHAPTLRPSGHEAAISATARVTFNWVTDFKRGGILVEEEDSYALVRRNDIRYYHLNDPQCAPIPNSSLGTSGFPCVPCIPDLTVSFGTSGSPCVPCIPDLTASFGTSGSPCVPSTRPSGDVNNAFRETFGIGVESGADADIIRNAIGSGPNAGGLRTDLSLPAGGSAAFTPLLSHGISLTALEEADGVLVHHNVISRVAMGIHTDAGADGAEISSNRITHSFAGLELFGGGDEIHHNDARANEYGIVVLGGGNNLHDNVALNNNNTDCLDTTTGDGTDSTDNTWTNNTGVTDEPDGICDPPES